MPFCMAFLPFSRLPFLYASEMACYMYFLSLLPFFADVGAFLALSVFFWRLFEAFGDFCAFMQPFNRQFCAFAFFLPFKIIFRVPFFYPCCLSANLDAFLALSVSFWRHLGPLRALVPL